MKRAHNTNFDQLIKEKLEHASVEPPPFVWDKIERQLPPLLPWYEKYKYLLLLLMVASTSVSSILIYKYVAMDKAIAQWKRSNITTLNTKTSVLGDNNTELIQQKISSTAIEETSATKKNGVANTVQSFYTHVDDSTKNVQQKIGPKNSLQIFLAQKSQRIQHMQAITQSAQQTAINKNSDDVEPQNENSKELSVATEKSTASVADFISTAKREEETIATASLGKVNVVHANELADHENIDNTTTRTIDVTVPIVHPFYSEVFPLTASMSTEMPNIPPLSSKEVLRSLIEPQKLEAFDDKIQQAVSVTDLNPKRDKMLKNLQHFKGYNINQGFHIGAFIGINNNWLSKKEFSADENTRSLKPVFQFGKSYGMNIGYDFSNRWGVQLEWQISEQGQRYKEVQDRGTIYRDVQLLYTKFPIMMKYKQTFINNYNAKPVSLSLLFGPQITYLIKQKVLVDNKLSSLAPSYNKVEFGIAAGMDIDLYLSRNLYMTIGARTGFSTSMQKDKPMQYQIGLLTQFNFKLPKKIK